MLLSEVYPQWIFITGARVHVVAEGNKRLSDEQAQKLLQSATVCWFDPARHNQLAGWTGTANPFLFCFCPGVSKVELPAGYGVPHRSNEPLAVVAQWANDDLYLQKTKLSLEVTVSFTHEQTIHPLRPVSTYAMALVQGTGAYFGVTDPRPDLHGPGCLQTQMIAGYPTLKDPQGRVFQSLWRLPAGKQRNTTLIDSQLSFPATVRAASPCFASGLEHLELRDRSFAAPIYAYPAQSPMVQQALQPDHHFELRCDYNNTSRSERLASAMVLLYEDAPRPARVP